MAHVSKSASSPPPLRAAATVVLLRDRAAAPEVFMVRRHERSAFMGGAYVFPGGRIDETDRLADDRWCDGIPAAAARMPDLGPAEATAFSVAAARELFEEAGVLLARHRTNEGIVSLASIDIQARFERYRRDVHAGTQSFRAVVEGEGLRLALDELAVFAHWVTPPLDARRFDTRFFLARMPPEQTPIHDAAETIESAWMTAADALARGRAGEIVLPPPTWTTLRELEPFGTVADAMTWARRRRLARREPLAVDEHGVRMLLLPGDPKNPAPWHEPLPRETRFVLAAGRWRAEAAPT